MKKQIPLFGLTNRSTFRAGVASALLICAVLMTLAACGGGGVGGKNISFDPKVDVFAVQGDGSGGGTMTAGRTFECTNKNPDGSCNVNVCKQGPGGATFDCQSFAAACLDAGHQYSGTREGGKCTRVL